jgi:NAD(P)-dependent dehydrogenase (short-subunit alcohol dehydrogenase family)
MTENDFFYRLFRPDLEQPTAEDMIATSMSFHLLPGVGWIEVSDVTDAVLFLVSDAASQITGELLTIDGGGMTKIGP